MKITEEMLIHIEQALEIKLYEPQKRCLLTGDYMGHGRGNGKTLVHCIKLALSEGAPLDLRKPEEFSDYGDGSRRYARSYYRKVFLDIWHSLNNYGLPVRDIRQ